MTYCLTLSRLTDVELMMSILKLNFHPHKFPESFPYAPTFNVLLISLIPRRVRGIGHEIQRSTLPP